MVNRCWGHHRKRHKAKDQQKTSIDLCRVPGFFLPHPHTVNTTCWSINIYIYKCWYDILICKFNSTISWSSASVKWKVLCLCAHMCRAAGKRAIWIYIYSYIEKNISDVFEKIFVKSAILYFVIVLLHAIILTGRSSPNCLLSKNHWKYQCAPVYYFVNSRWQLFKRN